MYQQVVRGVLRTANWRLSVGKALSLRAPTTSPWLRARNLVNRAPCSSSNRVADAHSHIPEPATPRPHERVQQVAALGVQLPELCSGCGVNLQAENPDAPG